MQDVSVHTESPRTTPEYLKGCNEILLQNKKVRSAFSVFTDQLREKIPQADIGIVGHDLPHAAVMSVQIHQELPDIDTYAPYKEALARGENINFYDLPSAVYQIFASNVGLRGVLEVIFDTKAHQEWRAFKSADKNAAPCSDTLKPFFEYVRSDAYDASAFEDTILLLCARTLRKELEEFEKILSTTLSQILKVFPNTEVAANFSLFATASAEEPLTMPAIPTSLAGDKLDLDKVAA